MFTESLMKRFGTACFSVLCFILSLNSAQAACTANIVGGATFATLQAAIDAAGTGATIQVTGSCNENVSILERKERITLDGQGTATINGPAANATVGVRGRGTVIVGFTITGGDYGIQVLRGTATIDSNVIQATGNGGILVNQGSFAIIVNNRIQNNLAGNGVSVEQNSSARVGFVTGNDTAASPNVIQNNGGRGITVTRSSTARIVGNTITGNTDDGIGVTRGSQAGASLNSINSNGGDGIFVSTNSGVNLGNDTGTTIFDLPNSTTTNNTGFGIRCTLNAYGNGRVGTLNGVSGPSSFAASCSNSIVP